MKLRLSNTRETTLKAVHLLAVSVLLAACCGCQTERSTPEERNQAAISRWITVESADDTPRSGPVLDQKDLNAIINGVPTISTVVVERVRTGKIESDDASAQAKVCGTRPEYLRLLKDNARVKLQEGRFIESIEAEEGANVVVLSAATVLQRNYLRMLIRLAVPSFLRVSS